MAVAGSPLATTRQQDMTIPGWGTLAPGRILLPLVLVLTFASHALNMFAYYSGVVFVLGAEFAAALRTGGRARG